MAHKQLPGVPRTECASTEIVRTLAVQVELHYERLLPALLELQGAVPEVLGRQPSVRQGQAGAAGCNIDSGSRGEGTQEGSSQDMQQIGRQVKQQELTAAPSAAASRLLLVLRCLELWKVKQVFDKQLPTLLQLLLFGKPQQADSKVDEVLCLTSEVDDDVLEQMLADSKAGFVMVKEVLSTHKGGCKGAGGRGDSKVPERRMQLRSTTGGGSPVKVGGGGRGGSRARGRGRPIKGEPAK